MNDVAEFLYRCRAIIYDRNDVAKKLYKLNREKRKLTKEIQQLDAELVKMSKRAARAMGKLFEKDKDRLKFYVRSLSVSAHISLVPNGTTKTIVEWDYEGMVRVTDTITGHTTTYKNESLRKFIEEVEKELAKRPEDLPGEVARNLEHIHKH